MAILLTPEQARQAEQELAERNAKIVERAPLDYRELGTIKIFNVGPWTWPVSMGGLGTFTILAYDPENPFKVGEGREERVFECSEPLEIWKLFPEGKHLDMNKMTEVFNRGEDIANSIVGVGKFQNRASSLERYGVFIAAGNLPTKREIAAANEKLRQWRLALVEEANAFFQAGELGNIAKQHRDAAVATGNTALPWVRGAVSMAQCPACMTPVNPEAAICMACKTVLNVEKVRQLKTPGYEHIWSPKANENQASK